MVYKVGGSKGIGGDPFISLGFSLGCDTFHLAGHGGVLSFSKKYLLMVRGSMVNSFSRCRTSNSMSLENGVNVRLDGAPNLIRE